METKRILSTQANLKILMVLPVIAAIMVVFSSCGQDKNPEVSVTQIAPAFQPPVAQEPDSVYTKVEEMPIFPGGDSALLKFVYVNTVYPEVAKKNNIQGKVIVQFCVTKKGSVSQVSIYKSVNPDIDDEALRVVKTLPDFQPGKQGGKPVSVWYMLPISFALK